jgi:hypothetical protein
LFREILVIYHTLVLVTQFDLAIVSSAKVSCSKNRVEGEGGEGRCDYFAKEELIPPVRLNAWIYNVRSGLILVGAQPTPPFLECATPECGNPNKYPSASQP